MAKAEAENGRNERALRALHRFTEQLDAEVQEALDAAKGRCLSPIESVQRRCEYLLARYLTPAQGRALPKQLLRKPAGLTVTADLATTLKAVEPHLLDACVRQMRAAIEMLRPCDGKPFGRKPIGARCRPGTRLGRREGVGASGAGRIECCPAIPARGRGPSGCGSNRRRKAGDKIRRHKTERADAAAACQGNGNRRGQGLCLHT